MATPKRSSSPVEDFNPLSDDQSPDQKYLSTAVNGDEIYDEDLNSTNSFGSDEDSISDQDDGRTLGQQYSITPPSIPRSQKREKKGQTMRSRHADRSYKEFLITKRQQQPKSFVNVIKNEYLADPPLCNLMELDSDDNMDRDTIRGKHLKKEKKKRESKETKKTLSLLRFNEREEKRLSEDFSMLHVSEALEQTGIKLDGSGRFSHLRQKVILPLSPECRARRQIAEVPECQKERAEFHNNFALLISLGTEAKKDKETKMSSSKRQFSVEQDVWRSTLIEQIWIELQAYINNNISHEEQIELLKKERQLHERVIDDINNFSFAETVSGDCPDTAFNTDTNTSNAFFSENGCRRSYKELVSRSVSASFLDVDLTNETVHVQENALIQVQKLLERLDHYESGFNSTKACEKENKKYKDPGFQRRVKCLNLWLNITCDLCQKLKLFGRIIGAHSRGIPWPLINFEFPKPQPHNLPGCARASVPDVLETEPTDSSDIDESEVCPNNSYSKDQENAGDPGGNVYLSPSRKQVKFQFGDESNSDQGSPMGSPSNEDPSNPLNSSTPIRGLNPLATIPSDESFLLGSSRTSSEANIEDCRQHNHSIYRHYAEKCLRKMGLQRLNVRLRDLFHRSLRRAKEALQRPKDTLYSDTGMDDEELPNGSEETVGSFSSGPASTDYSTRPGLARGSSLSEHGEWSKQFIEMDLPSFRPTYLFIVRIQLDVIHECLKLRKDQRPIGDPSFLSIRQLIRECKEVLKGATLVKQYYHYMVDAVLWDEQEAEAKYETDLTEFDEDMKNMLDVYFNYLQNWIYMLQGLPQASLGMKSALEEEWTFTKSICAYIMGGEAEAAKKFSSLASSLLSSIADFLDNNIDEYTRSLYDESVDDDEAMDDNGDDNDFGDDNESLESKRKLRKMAEMKQNVQKTLRNFKNLFNEARERASKALGFAKLLRMDLEVAADFNISVTTKELFSKLMETRHVQLCAPLSSGYMMFIPDSIKSNKQLILQLLNVTCGREDTPDPAKPADPNNSNHHNTSVKDDGYLLMMRCENGLDHVKECPRWTGFKLQVEPTAETAIALSHIEVMGLLFVVTNSGTLAQQRKTFENVMGKTIQLVNEQTSCHQSIAESLSELKTNALELMVKVAQAIQQVNEKLNFNEVIQQEENILKLYRETMLKIYDFGFEYQRELMRLISRDQREKMCQLTVSFAKDWMSFVINKCERGRGTRPRWATQGLEFISLACEPKNIVYLTNEEYENFQHHMLNSLSHIIGSSDRAVGPGVLLNRSNLDPYRGSQPSMQRLVSCPEARFSRSFSSRSVQSEPPSAHHSTIGLTPTSSASSNSFFGDNRGSRHSIPEIPEISVLDTADGRIYLDISQTRRGSRGQLLCHLAYFKLKTWAKLFCYDFSFTACL
ncbi:mitogen-activated protein kinase kinase kinase 4-like isoform X2 [Physella acuta]|uniref:mitogen-activated protein kinase kinase kinase 4-like isoform X2 n=1 Tax=Physella acuta TaxID=109671 RepID=UPI0027DD0636|nr:mitogen-activated protein kinase kinase kinase 4-like isoform X2 [Physella acuta]